VGRLVVIVGRGGGRGWETADGVIIAAGVRVKRPDLERMAE
jgi:hypothetical protein